MERLWDEPVITQLAQGRTRTGTQAAVPRAPALTPGIGLCASTLSIPINAVR